MTWRKLLADSFPEEVLSALRGGGNSALFSGFSAGQPLGPLSQGLIDVIVEAAADLWASETGEAGVLSVSEVISRLGFDDRNSVFVRQLQVSLEEKRDYVMFLDEETKSSLLERVKARHDKDATSVTEIPKGPGHKAPSKARRIWTRSHCPSCGKPGLDWLSQVEFSEKCGGRPARDTVRKRVADGKYCSDVQKRVPWCVHCMKKTPEGTGDVIPLVGENGKPKYVPVREEQEMLLEWIGDLLEKTFSLSLPADVGNPLNGGEELAVANLGIAVEAVLAEAASLGRMPTRDESEKIASEAIRKNRADEIRATKISGGNMETPPIDEGE